MREASADVPGGREDHRRGDIDEGKPCWLWALFCCTRPDECSTALWGHTHAQIDYAFTRGLFLMSVTWEPQTCALELDGSNCSLDRWVCDVHIFVRLYYSSLVKYVTPLLCYWTFSKVAIDVPKTISSTRQIGERFVCALLPGWTDWSCVI